jgi:hypothetical protein
VETALPVPFFEGTDNLGTHAYFDSPKDAERYQAARGGYVLETTPSRIWRVTPPPVYDRAKLVPVSQTEFYAGLDREESLRNAGTTTLYDPDRDETIWIIDTNPVGVSSGQVGASSNYRLISG